MKIHTIGMVLLGTFLLLLSVVGFTQINSPFEQRDIDLDDMRVRDFQSLSQMINDTVTDTNRLPPSLNDVSTSYRSAQEVDDAMTDPITKQRYTYEVVDDTRYKLCSTFATDTAATSTLRGTPSIPVMYAHTKGYDCIMQTVPQSYFKNPTPTPSIQQYQSK